MNFFKKILLALITILVTGSLLIALNFLLFDQKAGAQSPVPRDTRTTKVPPTDHSKGPVTLKVAQIRDTGFLRLVNARTKTGTARAADLVKSADGLHRYHQSIRADLAAFLAFCEENGNGLYISSAYRSLKDQEAIYAKTQDKSLVQVPGYSEHHTGLAVDLQPVKALQGVVGAGLAKEKAFMEKNAWRYGFIQRYPDGKEDKTGIAFEYWHFRYIGRPHAEYMYTHDLVLEEYLELVHYRGQLELATSDGRYVVYWREPDNGRIFLPAAEDYVISSTNTGAYLITVKTGD